MMLYGGILLIIIAIILGSVQHFGGSSYNMYGDESNKWYFWGLVGVIGLIGLVLAIWAYMKKEKTTTTPPS
jgi:Na+/melibiose symporter-like transporter